MPTESYLNFQENTLDTKTLHDLFKSYQLLIFDLDGTLADTMPLHYQACQEVCQPLGFDFPLDFFYEQAGIPTQQVFINLMSKLGLKHDGVALAKEKEKRFQALIPQVKPLPFSLKLLEHFKEEKKIAIRSGGERITVLKTLEALNLKVKYDAIVTADDVMEHKPRPETFLKCAEITNIEPAHCIVLEDGLQGMIAAKAAEMDCFDVIRMEFFR